MRIKSKTCSKCQVTQPIDAFTKDGNQSDGLRVWCRVCARTSYRARRGNPDTPRRGERGIPLRARELRRKYDMTLEEYEALLHAQKKACAICGSVDPRHGRGPTGASPYLAVDHDHTSGLVRGLLCHPCNRGLGQLQDSEEILEKAIAYLRRTTPRTPQS